ncbi:hypothetical protein [Streptomyces sp. NPDC050121]
MTNSSLCKELRGEALEERQGGSISSLSSREDSRPLVGSPA